MEQTNKKTEQTKNTETKTDIRKKEKKKTTCVTTWREEIHRETDVADDIVGHVAEYEKCLFFKVVM